jgi:hypothetical protein
LVALERPVSRGFALLLMLAILVVLGWTFYQQNESLEQLKSATSEMAPARELTADPQVCWLMGANAYAVGRGEQMSQVLASAPTQTDCVAQAQRGALGQGPYQ